MMVRLLSIGLRLAGCGLSLALLAACASVSDRVPPPVTERAAMPAAVQAEPSLPARTILERAHEAAGGADWRDVKSLYLEGYNIIRKPDGSEVLWDKYAMWREFSDEKLRAHAAEGKVRIEAWTGDQLAMLIAFDGATTYTKDGPMEAKAAEAAWASNFGFGAIRNGLDAGWTQARLPDDLVDGTPAYFIELVDPSGSKTRFGIRQSDYATVYVGFSTPRGWHERRYSHFFRVEGSRWMQAGRVRLFYDGVKANEAVWRRAEIGKAADESVFVVRTAPEGPSF